MVGWDVSAIYGVCRVCRKTLLGNTPGLGELLTLKLQRQTHRQKVGKGEMEQGRERKQLAFIGWDRSVEEA